jgi:preprotein translocase subunit SecD
VVYGEEKMNPLIKNWQLTLVAIFIILAALMVFNPMQPDRAGYYSYTNIKLGIDFEGGTVMQLELQEEVTPDEIARIGHIISKRADPSGLMNISVTPIGKKFIVIKMPESDPEKLELIESRIRQQGKFEATLNGEVLFTGDEIQKVLRTTTSYGLFQAGPNVVEWRLPFILNEKASRSFTTKTFHQCSETFTPQGAVTYTCEKTFFFLDKPEALIVTSEDQYEADKELFLVGDLFQNIPQDTDIEELIEDSNLFVIVAGETLDKEILASALTTTSTAFVSADVTNEVIVELEEFGFTVTKTEYDSPWIWNALGARQVISLTENITNEDLLDPSQAELISTLVISGRRDDGETARADLEELTILLESGSLPTPVKSISKETISPSLGESFKGLILMMGIVAFIIVALVVTLRYRNAKLAIPIFIIGASEVLINLGFITIIQWPLDLAAFAGLIAAIGTGVDSEIVITDEVMGRKDKASMSLIKRIKTALFIIMTAAFTIIGVMGPIVLFSRSFPGIDKLYGFAVVAIAGALIGAFITRPAFTKIIEKIVEKMEKE